MPPRWIFCAVLLGLAVVVCPGEELDRLVAIVNGHPILQSDWEDEVRFESFTSGRRLTEVTSEERKAALDRLIDQELLREQMRIAELKPTPHEQAEKQFESLKQDYLRDHPGQSWDAALSSYQLTEALLTDRIAAELDQLRLVDTRFRSSVRVDPQEIEKYYKEQLAPNLPSSDPMSLTEATPRIREILIQEKINQQLSSWLEILRAQAQIRMISSDSSFNTAQVGPP